MGKEELHTHNGGDKQEDTSERIHQELDFDNLTPKEVRRLLLDAVNKHPEVAAEIGLTPDDIKLNRYHFNDRYFLKRIGEANAELYPELSSDTSQ